MKSSSSPSPVKVPPVAPPARQFCPMWFWNDRLEADEIRWQVGQMAAQGVRGFYIHPRQGLRTPYLSEAFFDLVEVAVEAARRHGLKVHLYDEYPYPSGVAGGAVVLGEPRFGATRLEMVDQPVAGGPVRLALPEGKVLSCVVFPEEEKGVRWEEGRDVAAHVGMVLDHESYNETGLTSYNRKRYFASGPVPTLEVELPRRQHRLVAVVQVEVRDFKYWGQYTDVLNPEAVARFIELTHQRYHARCGKDFGGLIESIFVDETAPWWTPTMPEKFHQEYGYELAPALPALALASHPDHARVRADFERLRYRLFCDSFERPVGDWCRRHGIAYGGEKPSFRLSQLRFMDLPGCDPGHTKAGAYPLDMFQPHLRANARATASAAYFYHKADSLCECYHSLGWAATLQDAKLVADGLLLAGISRLVPHGFFYSTHSLRKHDAPPSFFFQMPYWPKFHQLSQHVERVGALFEHTWIEASLAMVEPGGGVPDEEDRTVAGDLMRALLESHREFHLVDTDILEEGELRDGGVQLRDVFITTLLVPPMAVEEKALTQWLGRFADRGGRVVRIGRNGLADALEGMGPTEGRRLRVLSAGVEEPGIYTVHRRGPGGRQLWFLVNVTGRELDVTLETEEGGLREVPLDPALPVRLEGRSGRHRRVVRPFESFVVEADGGAEQTAGGGEAEGPAVLAVQVRAEAEIRLEGPNFLRLGQWELSLREREGSWSRAALVAPMPLANQLSKAGLAVEPDFRLTFGLPPVPSVPSLRVRYRARFECDFAGAVALLMEPDSLGGEWTMRVNQGPPVTAADFQTKDHPVRGYLGCDITAAVQPGENEIVIEVETRRGDDGLRNPLYLAGDFGVGMGEPRLVPWAGRGRIETYAENGLPYFSGVLSYRSGFRLAEVPGGEDVLLDLGWGREFREACEVSVNGSPARTLCWEPRLLRLPTSLLRAGENEVEVRVFTALSRLFEGQAFDEDAHGYRDSTAPVGD